MFFNPIQQGRDANNNPITPLTDKRFNQPFHVYDVSYDSGADQLDFNVGVGRAVFDETVVEQTSETTFSYSNPSASTTYHGYLNSDGSYTLDQSASATSKRNSSLLFKLDTPSDLSNTGADDLTDLRNMLPANSNMQVKRIEVFTSDGTFNVPSGVSEVLVTMVAGGGSGASMGNSDGGSGGGGGGETIISKRVDVSNDSDITVSVGSGGSAPASGNGSDGGDSSFKGLTVSGGGGGNQGGNQDNGEGGSGGGGALNSTSNSGGIKGIEGGDGASEADPAQTGEGGGGGASHLGQGGDGGTGINPGGPGDDGEFPGGGGGGSADEGGSGGDGADGIVIVQW